MKTFSVSYDLNKPGQNYDNLIKELKRSHSWWHYLDSTWLIKTNESASQLSTRIRKHLDNNDNVLVIRVTKDYSGWLPQKAWDWINANVLHCATYC